MGGFKSLTGKLAYNTDSFLKGAGASNSFCKRYIKLMETRDLNGKILRNGPRGKK